MTSREVLGGRCSPLGWSVGFLEAPVDEVLNELVQWRRAIGQHIEVCENDRAWPSCLDVLMPLEAPWTCELIIDHGRGWTAYLNNDLGGGDPAPPLGHLSKVMGRVAVLATHQPRVAGGHASTQLEVLGPQGELPLGYMRMISAHAEDGRWSWHLDGDPLPFERPESYEARLVRDRFTRAHLVEYLAALGIRPDDATAFGRAVSIKQQVSWPTRQRTFREARAFWQLD